ncbi:hypothetical protein CcCBS67573_g06484 [Chytriomyces confervae]|uniref:Carrier domain-containing protein n=1 Tax=Chytriomyces confervae TaxID=246404 RepID=A0A507F360_9FUNG|nr:hypothetical protein CcCBS67573_g06484 [Chytriomyces confervae]
MSQGLPPNLCWDDASFDFGHKGLDTSMAAYMSEVGHLAQPVSVHVQSAELHNQSVNSLALISARMTAKTVKVIQMMVSCHLYTLCQAADLRAVEARIKESVETVVEKACSKNGFEKETAVMVCGVISEQLADRQNLDWSARVKFAVDLVAGKMFTKCDLSECASVVALHADLVLGLNRTLEQAKAMLERGEISGRTLLAQTTGKLYSQIRDVVQIPTFVNKKEHDHGVFLDKILKFTSDRKTVFPFVASCLEDLHPLAVEAPIETIVMAKEECQTLPQLLMWQADHHGDSILLRIPNKDGSNGRQVSFAEFQTLASQVSNAMIRTVSENQQTIAFMANSSLEAMCLTMGAWKASWTVATLSPRSPQSLLAKQIRLIKATTLAVSIEDIELGRALVVATGLPLITIDRELQISVVNNNLKTATANAVKKSHEPTKDSAAVWIFSSSSVNSEAVKAMQLTHEQILLNCASRDQLWKNNGCDLTYTDCVLTWLPFGHVMGLIVDFCNNGLYSGATLAFRPSRHLPASPDLLLKDIQFVRPQLFYSVPWVLNAWSRGSLLTDYLECFKNFKGIVSGGAPLSRETGAFLAGKGIRVVEGFGATEAGGTILSGLPTGSAAEHLSDDGWVQALPGVTLSLIPDDSVTSDSGYDIGELCVGGRSISKVAIRNMNNDSASESYSPQNQQGMFATGDIFESRPSRSNELEYRFVSRRDDLVLSSTGISLSPLVVEEQLSKIAGVEKAAVLGNGHEDVKVVLQRGGPRDSELLQKETLECLRKYAPDVVVALSNVIILPDGMEIPLSQKKTVLRNKLRGIIASLDDAVKSLQVKEETVSAPAAASHDSPDTVKFIKVFQEELQRLGFGIDVNESFEAKGLDSMSVTRLAESLSKQMGINVMPQTFYEFETPLKLIVAFSHESINAIEEKSPLESVKGEYQQVAIIGVGCRFPGDINTPEEYWNALMAGHNFINGVPEDRADISGIKGGFLSKRMTQMFDGAMFGISPLEAKAMDPQQRILLETAWNALEHANVQPSSINGTNTAVFASIRSQGFDRKMADVYGTEMPRYMATGVDQALPANRISHFFKLKGVSYNLTSACNSGALLLDCASKAFADPTCDRAIIGGSSISSHQTYFDILRSAGIMSTDNGRCAVFDSSADGYVPTESCIVFVVRPLEAAIRDGEKILGVVEGIVNHHNGGDSMGIAAPSKTRQIEVLKGTLDYVGWKPDEVDLYEAHVTGTKLGDQLEASVITTVFKSETRTVPLSIGALKGSLGHTENLSALAAILKVIMAMNVGTLPPNLVNPKTMHKNILQQFESIPAVVPHEVTEWPTSSPAANAIKKALVLSAGLGGSISGIAVTSGPKPIISKKDSSVRSVLAISAFNSRALDLLRNKYIEFLTAKNFSSLEDACLTGHYSRHQFNARLAVSGANADEMVEKLMQWKRESTPQTLSKVVLVFPGQTSMDYIKQFYALADIPAYAAIIKECETGLTELGIDMDIFNPQTFPEEQVVAFVMQYAVARFYLDLGLKPVAVLGHSFGEIIAAAVAGNLTASSGMWVAYNRAVFLSANECRGRMVSVFCKLDVLDKLITDSGTPVSVAVHNGVTHNVISGSDSDIEDVIFKLEEAGISFKELHMTVAFHSMHLKPAASLFGDAARMKKLSNNPLRIPLASSSLNELIQDGPLPANHWEKHIINPVHFIESVDSIFDAFGVVGFLEVGSGTALNIVKRHVMTTKKSVQADVSYIQTNIDIASSLAELYQRGVNLKWDAYYGRKVGSTCDLPMYQFDRINVWESNKYALTSLETIQAANTTPSLSNEPVAIVGSGLRFPAGINTLQGLWNATNAKFELGTVPKDRPAFLYPEPEELRVAFLDNMFSFDNSLFELENLHLIDPVCRVILETAWHALEDANVVPSEIQPFRSSFIHCTMQESMSYTNHLRMHDISFVAPKNAGILIGDSASFIAEKLGFRASYTSILLGHCNTIVTAMGTAHEQLNSGTVDVVLIACATVMLDSRQLKETIDVFFSYGATVNLGEGSVVLVLKRKADAESDGNKILSTYNGPLSRLKQTNDDPFDMMKMTLESSRVHASDVGRLIVESAFTDINGAQTAHFTHPTLRKNKSYRPLAIAQVEVLLSMVHFCYGMQNGLYAPNEDWPLVNDSKTRTLLFSYLSANMIFNTIIFQTESIPQPANKPIADIKAPLILAIYAKSRQSLARLLAQFLELVEDPKTDLQDLCRASRILRTPMPYRIIVSANTSKQLANTLISFDLRTIRPAPLPESAILSFGCPSFSSVIKQWVRDLPKIHPTLRQLTIAQVFENVCKTPLKVLFEQTSASQIAEHQIMQLMFVVDGASNSVSLVNCESFAECLSMMHMQAGIEINWKLFDTWFYPSDGNDWRKRVALPLYEFNRSTVALPDPKFAQTVRMDRFIPTRAIYPDLEEKPDSQTFEVDLISNDFLFDHRLNNANEDIILPGAALASLTFSVLKLEKNSTVSLDFVAPVLFSKPELSLTFTGIQNQKSTILLENGTVASSITVKPAMFQPEQIVIETLKGNGSAKIDGPEAYAFRHGSIIYGPAFQGIQELYLHADGSVSARIDLSRVDMICRTEDWLLHPAIFDCCIHMMGMIDDNSGYIPGALNGLSVDPEMTSLPNNVWCHQTVMRNDKSRKVFLMKVYDAETGKLLLRADELVVVRTMAQLGGSTRQNLSQLMRKISWREQDKTAQDLSLENSVSQFTVILDTKRGDVLDTLRASAGPHLVISSLAEIPTAIEILLQLKHTHGFERIQLIDLEGMELPAVTKSNVRGWWKPAELIIKFIKQLAAKPMSAGLVRLLDVVVVTRGLVSLADGEKSSASAAAIWGVAKNLKAELNIKTCVLDFEANDSTEVICQALMNTSQFTNAENNLPLLAHRQKTWYSGFLETLALDKETLETLHIGSKEILITGGVGGLAVALAKDLIQLKHKVYLAGRRSAMDSEVMSVLDELNSPLVEYVQCDTSKADDLASLFRETWLDGIIHTAGVLRDELFSNVNDSSIEYVGLPKVNGAINILSELEGQNRMVSVILISSIASAIGSPGQTSYVMANSFLDSLAEEYKTHPHLKVKSMQLGLVKNVGMGASVDGAHQDASVTLEAEEASEAILSVLMNPERFSGAAIAIAPLHKANMDGNNEGQERVEYTAAEIQEHMTKTIGDSLGFSDGFDPASQLIEIGMDSIAAVMVQQDIAKTFQVRISAQEILATNLIGVVKQVIELRK